MRQHYRHTLRARSVAAPLILIGLMLPCAATEPSLSQPVVPLNSLQPVPNGRGSEITRRTTSAGVEMPRLTARDRTGDGATARSTALPTFGFSLMVLAGVVLSVVAAGQIAKRLGAGGSGILPQNVAETLGRCRVEPRQSVHLLKVGTRILVLSSSNGSLTLLTEITDPVEVDLLAGQCRSLQSASPFAKLLARETADHSTDVLSSAESVEEGAIRRPFSAADFPTAAGFPTAAVTDLPVSGPPMATAAGGLSPTAEQRLAQRLRRPSEQEAHRAA